MKLLGVIILCILNTGIALAQNDQRFYTNARVTRLEPVTERYRSSKPKSQCQQPALSIAGNIAQDIRQQERRQAKQTSCESTIITDQRTTGYWVTYEYQGRTGRKFLLQKPGKWIRVSVSVKPMLDSLGSR